MDDHEENAKYNLAETCCASISLHDLESLSSSSEPHKSILDYSQKQVYGAIRGSETLRANIAALYNGSGKANLTADNVLVTSGAIQANFLALYTNVGPGDHVICQYPTYQQLYSVPESLGAEVSLWRSNADDGWRLDLDELKALIRPNTKLIIIKCVAVSPSTMPPEALTPKPHQQPPKPHRRHPLPPHPLLHRRPRAPPVHHHPQRRGLPPALPLDRGPPALPPRPRLPALPRQ